MDFFSQKYKKSEQIALARAGKHPASWSQPALGPPERDVTGERFPFSAHKIFQLCSHSVCSPAIFSRLTFVGVSEKVAALLA
jgi:hypothetical protein